MHSVSVLVPYLMVNGLKREWRIDLPELISIRLGDSAFQFKDYYSTELIMRSDDDEMKWWIDLPKLRKLTSEGWNCWSFRYPRSITLEGITYHSILTNRHALSHHCHPWQGIYLPVEENHSHQEFLSLLSFIPRHHSRSQKVSLIPSFFHTRFTINSLQTTHSHFITLSIITPHSSAIPNREMQEDVRFHHFQSTFSISLHNSTNHITLTQ